VSNVELRCRTHNLYQAECDYGKEVTERYRNSGNRVSEPAAVYTFCNRDFRARSGAGLSIACRNAVNAT